MTTATYDGIAVPVRDDSTRRARRILMQVNGGFLALIGAAQVTFELLSHYAGAGIYGPDFEGSPYTIGWVENHGFALLVGVLFIAVAAADGRRFWHLFAVGVHVLLGTANVLFWSSFAAFDVVAMGLFATVAHVLFVAAHIVALTSSRAPVSR
jgi:hypothetical protein